jgi:2-polyprenyl-3-methyl-5-hydroxy-6-metoxy-1,4-benzoquinol methylase
MNLKSTYNKIAEDWATDHVANTWWVGEIKRFYDLLPTGATILDVGCGAGFKTQGLTERGFKVKGIDFSEKMIEVAKRKYPSLDFDVMDVYDLEQMNEKFDAVFALAVILHVPKKRVLEVLQKMKDRLNPGGLLYIAVKEKKEGGAQEEIKKENDYGYDYERFFSYFNIQELKDYLKSLGMELVYDSITNDGRTNWLQVVGKKT